MRTWMKASTESATVYEEASDSLNETHEEDPIIETPIISAVDRVVECPAHMVSYLILYQVQFDPC